MTGTANVFLSTTTANGQAELAQTTTISSQSQAYKTVMYYQQDAASNDLVWYGGPDYTLTPPVPTVPGSWAKGVSFTTQSTDQTGQQVTVSLKVIGTETVSVPLGRFQTWKVTASQDIKGFENTTGTYWYAPQIGTYVKVVFNSTSNAGGSYDYSLDLTSTSVPLTQ